MTDKQVLSYLWDNWDSKDVTIEKLIDIQRDGAISSEVKSEIWHLISVRAIELTKQYSVNALQKGKDEPWIHDNIVFGSGQCSLDYRRKNNNWIIQFYMDLYKARPMSIITNRVLLEQLILANKIDQAKEHIAAIKRIIPDAIEFWSIYEAICRWKEGEKQAIAECEEKILTEVKNKYIYYLMIAEHYANNGCYSEALEKYQKAYQAQNGNRKIDPLICIYKIHELQNKYTIAKETLLEIVKVYKDDYDCVDDDEVKVYKDEIERIDMILIRGAS